MMPSVLDKISLFQNRITNQPHCPEKRVAPFVLARLVVLPAIRLNRDLEFNAREIENERRHRMLTTEMPSHPVASQSRPQSTLGVRWTMACAPCDLDFEQHGRHPLPALPALSAGEMILAAPRCQLLDGTAHE